MTQTDFGLNIPMRDNEPSFFKRPLSPLENYNLIRNQVVEETLAKGVKEKYGKDVPEFYKQFLSNTDMSYFNDAEDKNISDVQEQPTVLKGHISNTEEPQYEDILKSDLTKEQKIKAIQDREQIYRDEVEKQLHKDYARIGLGSALSAASFRPFLNIPYVGTGLGGAMYDLGQGIVEGDKLPKLAKRTGRGFVIGEALGAIPYAGKAISKTKAGQVVTKPMANGINKVLQTPFMRKTSDVLKTDIFPYKLNNVMLNKLKYINFLKKYTQLVSKKSTKVQQNKDIDIDATDIFNPDDIDIVRKFRNQPSLYEQLTGKQNTEATSNSLYNKLINNFPSIEHYNNPQNDFRLLDLNPNSLNKLNKPNKPIIIKQIIVGKNKNNHPEVNINDYNDILNNALYNHNYILQVQPNKRPNYYTFINKNKYDTSVLDMDNNKSNYEVVNWFRVNNKRLQDYIKRTKNEGGDFLIND